MVEDQSGHYPFLTGASPKPRNGGYLRALIVLKMTKNHDESQVDSNDGNTGMREVNISLRVFKIELVMFSN